MQNVRHGRPQSEVAGGDSLHLSGTAATEGAGLRDHHEVDNNTDVATVAGLRSGRTNTTATGTPARSHCSWLMNVDWIKDARSMYCYREEALRSETTALLLVLADAGSLGPAVSGWVSSLQ
jgi:hypothetical protein